LAAPAEAERIPGVTRVGMDQVGGLEGVLRRLVRKAAKGAGKGTEECQVERKDLDRP